MQGLGAGRGVSLEPPRLQWCEPLLPPPTPFSSPAAGGEEAPPLGPAISQVTITTKHLKCQHLRWVAFRHNWRRIGNTTAALGKRKWGGEARQQVTVWAGRGRRRDRPAENPGGNSGEKEERLDHWKGEERAVPWSFLLCTSGLCAPLQ